MKLTNILRSILAAILLLGLFGCGAAPLPPDTGPTITESIACTESTAPPEITEPLTEATVPQAAEQDIPAETTEATQPTESEDYTEQTQPKQQESKPPTQTPAVKPTSPPATEGTEPTDPPQTEPPQTEPPVKEPPATELPTTEPPTEPTEPETYEITGEFERQVAQYALQYINQYRRDAGISACTYLPGMTQVAKYRANQLTYNFSHSTADKREALAYYQYGRYVDATLAGLPKSESYYEADSAEAICAGFKGMDAEALGKAIAKLIRNSGSHWSYIGSSEYSYIGVGAEYREGSEYGWYACVMVGSVNYG